MIFVAHSLGGLVVEQALLISRGSAQKHVKDLLESTVAIAFMGTPHMGSSKANLAGPLTRLTSLLRRTNRKLVQVLTPNSEVLATVQQEFHTMLDDRAKNNGREVEIYCFYEEKAMLGIGEVGDTFHIPVQRSAYSDSPDRTKRIGHSPWQTKG